jgi:hypothetical protein
LALAIAVALALAGWQADRRGRLVLACAALTAGVLYAWCLGLWWAWRTVVRSWRQRRPPSILAGLAAVPGLVVALGLYAWFAAWALRPDLLPQRTCYDLIDNLHVTARLVDPALLKVERWEILGTEQEVLFVHPARSGSVALVYPVKIKPGTTLRADLAVAPEAWAKEGDGMAYSVYVEDESGMHLVYSRYVDPKHHLQDRRWLPIGVDLSPFRGKLVRLILAVESGPAGDQAYDWAGWARPRLERPVWP